jgi:hypothetical protein
MTTTEHTVTYIVNRPRGTVRASCSCGWRGEARYSRELARYDYAEHTVAAGVVP